jgi:hypothetical protein
MKGWSWLIFAVGLIVLYGCTMGEPSGAGRRSPGFARPPAGPQLQNELWILESSPAGSPRAEPSLPQGGELGARLAADRIPCPSSTPA